MYRYKKKLSSWKGAVKEQSPNWQLPLVPSPPPILSHMILLIMANQNKKGLRNTLNFSFLGEEFNESLKRIASSYKLWNICSKKPNLKKKGSTHLNNTV